MTRLTVGVLGGMGPAATLEFMARVHRRLEAATDQDGLRLIVDSNPLLPDRNAAIGGRGPSPGPELAAMARGLQHAGADFLVMPCNTAHAFAPDIAEAVAIPFVDLITETCAITRARSRDRRAPIGLLAAEGCLEAGLYQDALTRLGYTTVFPEGPWRVRFMTLLYDIKSGAIGTETTARMAAIAQALVGRGAQVLIAGCTEVPLVLSATDVPSLLVDSLDVLSAATVDFALGRRPLPAPGQALRLHRRR